ncbi:hypothetical protein [Streptomyces sp. NPDC048496]|uniref:hypothetical protein n=1 Tax=Streptomyces sp. NPDC048496 TaxID=3365558 RepID=UPI00371E50C5
MSNWGTHDQPDSVDELMRRFTDWIDAPFPQSSREKLRSMRERIKEQVVAEEKASSEAKSIAQHNSPLPDVDIIVKVQGDAESYYTPPVLLEKILEKMLESMVLYFPKPNWRGREIWDPVIGSELFLRAVTFDAHGKRDADLRIHDGLTSVELKRYEPDTMPPDLCKSELNPRRAAAERIAPASTPLNALVIFALPASENSTTDRNEDVRKFRRVDAGWPDKAELEKLSAMALLQLHTDKHTGAAILALPESSAEMATQQKLELVREHVKEAFFHPRTVSSVRKLSWR